MKRLAAVLGTLLLSTAAAAAPDDEAVVIAAPENVPWTGLPGASADGPAGQILYPAPTLLGGLISVLTHAALVSGTRTAEDQRRQREADKVLEPYLAALTAMTPQALVEAAVAGSAGRRRVGADAPARWRVELAPTFVLYPDRNRLMLDAKLRVIDLGVPGTAPFETDVRVLSNHRPGEDGFPSDGDAAELRREAAQVFAHAVDVALFLHRRQRDGAGDDLPFRTHRYLNGARDGVERAQLLGLGCARLLLRTLRGGLLSVPVRPTEAAAPVCADQPYRFPVVAAAEPASAAGSAAAR